MDKGLEALKIIKEECSFAFGGTANGDRVRENLPIIENELNDNYFYKHMISKICNFMGLKINPFEDLVKTENEIIDWICNNGLTIDNEKKLKALEIIKNNKVDVNMIVNSDTYIDYIQLFTREENFNKIMILEEEFYVLKEVLL